MFKFSYTLSMPLVLVATIVSEIEFYKSTKSRKVGMLILEQLKLLDW